ncbi:MAG: hypothetical protein HBSAPP03_21860 [Phycisphaerae bacterium]|nr:MAG: hypothetical protein HBSAPP03_21860 [Phycisphaerae bacterium]
MERTRARLRAGGVPGWARGVTILEILIALALLLALAGLAWPTLGSLGTRGALREAEGILAGAALRVRAEAQTRGRVMELWAGGPAGRELIMREAKVASTEEGSGIAAPVPRGDRIGMLPASVRVEGAPPSSAAPVDGAGTGDEGSDPRGVRMLVCWPVGISEMSGAWSVHAGEGRRVPRVNGWTGAMTFEDVREDAEGDEGGERNPSPEGSTDDEGRAP